MVGVDTMILNCSFLLYSFVSTLSWAINELEDKGRS